jgi:small-conductance mechanosensitive channel
MTQMGEKPVQHKYKKGTTFVFFGVLLVVLGVLMGGGGISPLLLIAGIVLLIVGVAKKSERAS